MESVLFTTFSGNILFPIENTILVMKKIIIAVVACMVLLCAGGYAVVTSFGSFTGHAILSPALSFDIIETGSDVNTTATDDSSYTLESVYQGETKWVKIKLKNSADVPVRGNISVSGSEECAISIMSADKSVQLENPANITSGDFYFWIKHTFVNNASPGQYLFEINIMPA